MTHSFPDSHSDTPISPQVVKRAMLAEKYVLPWIYTALAFQRLGVLRWHYAEYRALKELPTILKTMQPWAENLAWAALTKDVLLILLMLFTGITLLFSRAPVILPSKLKHVLVPLAMSYYFLLYGLVDGSPNFLRVSLIPPRFQGVAALSGLVLSALGYALAIWSLAYLGRSFSILVSIRKVTLNGPYAYVRHPIYLGYVMDLGGLLLANTSFAMLALATGFFVFLIIRARMEEEVLCAADENYRLYFSRTGFLLPRWNLFKS